ncbi:MAG: LacI family DNA-binding transcriptional regulator [Frateuria sp.]|uniref:LacI family DNA-binding transcriptional regulator n=1 Tax=Frateuria sp. TaxID=2211372 RepID=UPI00178F741F|nr:LacI family DNA-binding transcriptional regulator [Frateuria sp.]NUO72365.1 LacI family DNA-binding transcriptional regulator [Frateuria sp.]NUR23105.1 LacI family DNA-binding transcriptional regulator [Frateuria sp.]
MLHATIKDVAKRAGVSLKTVSRVINRESSVREDTREKVERAIEALGYRPNLSARSLRSAHSYAIGLVYDNPNAHYVISMQNGVLSACRERGFGLQIHPCDSTSPQLAEELCALVRRSRLAGLVLAPPMSEQPQLIATLKAHDICFVRILAARTDPADGSPCVWVDDRDAAYAITEHLIQLGHTRIGFLWGEPHHRSSPERYQGYADALKDYGLPLNKKLILPGRYAFDDGFRGARKLLALKEPPTAIFGSNDEIAAGVLAAARSAGLDVPWDLSIAGFEDNPFSKQAWPALTTARQSTAEIGRHAALRLMAELQQDGSAPDTANEGFVPELVVRGSTAPPKKG